MSAKKIDIGAAVKSGWQIFTKNWLFFIGAILVLFLVQLGENLIRDSFPEKENIKITLELVAILLEIAFYAINILIGLGLIKICLDFLNNKQPKFSALFSQSNLIIKSFLAGLLVGLISILPVVVPLGIWGVTMFMQASVVANVLRIVFGALGIIGVFFMIYFALRFMFYQYFLVDRNSGIIESLRLSSEATRGVKWQLLLFCLVVFAIMLLGVLVFFVGIFVAMPIVMIASATIYLQLTGQKIMIEPAKPDKPAAA